MMKQHDSRSNWGGKRLFGLHFYISLPLKEARTGTQIGQNLEAGAEAEPWWGAAYWLALPGLFTLIMEPRTTSPNVTPYTNNFMARCLEAALEARP